MCVSLLWKKSNLGHINRRNRFERISIIESSHEKRGKLFNYTTNNRQITAGIWNIFSNGASNKTALKTLYLTVLQIDTSLSHLIHDHMSWTLGQTSLNSAELINQRITPCSQGNFKA